MVLQYNTESSPSTAIDINEPFFKQVVFCLFLSFSSDLIDDGILIHIYPVSLILKPIKLFIIGILYELINCFFSALIIIILLLKDKDFAYSSTICMERNLTNTNLHLVQHREVTIMYPNDGHWPIFPIPQLRPSLQLSHLVLHLHVNCRWIHALEDKDKIPSVNIRVTELILKGPKRVHSAFVVSLIT